jgi:hypothetical protein
VCIRTIFSQFTYRQIVVEYRQMCADEAHRMCTECGRKWWQISNHRNCYEFLILVHPPLVRAKKNCWNFVYSWDVGQCRLKNYENILCVHTFTDTNINSYVTNHQVHIHKIYIYFYFIIYYHSPTCFMSLLRPSSGCRTRIHNVYINAQNV